MDPVGRGATGPCRIGTVRSMTEAAKCGRLDGRVVIVTGGNGGIGLGMADAMAAAGADLVIWGRDQAKNDAAVEQLRSHGNRVASLAVDVAVEAAVDEASSARRCDGGPTPPRWDRPRCSSPTPRRCSTPATTSSSTAGTPSSDRAMEKGATS